MQRIVSSGQVERVWQDVQLRLSRMLWVQQTRSAWWPQGVRAVTQVQCSKRSIGDRLRMTIGCILTPSVLKTSSIIVVNQSKMLDKHAIGNEC